MQNFGVPSETPLTTDSSPSFYEDVQRHVDCMQIIALQRC